MVTESLSGIYSALVTPMLPNESLNLEALKALVEAELRDGVEGLYVCGSSGEGLLLTLSERMQVLEATLNAVDGRVPVIGHVGTIRTRDTIALAQHAQAAGAAAISMIPPYYYRFTLDEIIGYYEDVLRAVPGFPVLIYNIPQFTSVSFDKYNARQLLDNPQVIGVKHTSQDLYGLERMRDAHPDKLYFNGFDEMYLPAMSIGASATIGTTVNVFAPLFLQVRERFLAGDMQGALTAQRMINERVELMVQMGIFSATKYLWQLRGLDLGACRAPFQPLSEADKAALHALCQD